MGGLRGYRNLTLGLAYIAGATAINILAIFYAPESLGSMAGINGGLGIGTAGVVGLRAANKWAEGKNGGVE